MFMVLLTFTSKKDKADEMLDAHKAWITRGFRDDVFLLVGSLQDGLGGGILAHNTTRSALEDRVNEDPFVVEGIVKPEVIELDPAKTDERLEFLATPSRSRKPHP